jgi:hypothetical protein
MARLGHAPRHTTFTSIAALAAALLSAAALMSASVNAKSLPMQVYSTLSEAVSEFHRYNKRKLVIADRTIGYIPISGKFPGNNVQGFVAALRPLGVKAVEPDGDPIQLTGAKRPH